MQSASARSVGSCGDLVVNRNSYPPAKSADVQCVQCSGTKGSAAHRTAPPRRCFSAGAGGCCGTRSSWRVTYEFLAGRVCVLIGHQAASSRHRWCGRQQRAGSVKQVRCGVLSRSLRIGRTVTPTCQPSYKTPPLPPLPSSFLLPSPSTLSFSVSSSPFFPFFLITRLLCPWTCVCTLVPAAAPLHPVRSFFPHSFVSFFLPPNHTHSPRCCLVRPSRACCCCCCCPRFGPPLSSESTRCPFRLDHSR